MWHPMTWRAIYARPCLAAALADYPVIAGRARAKSGQPQDMEIVLNDAGVRPYQMFPMYKMLTTSSTTIWCRLTSKPNGL